MQSKRSVYMFLAGMSIITVTVLAAWSITRPSRAYDPAPMDELLAEAEAAGAAVVEWDLTMTHNEHVQTWINFLTGRNAERTRLWLERSGRYGPFIQEELRRRGMPQDLLYLALIESGFSPYAHSVAAAVGIWQFIAETGRRYGLEINSEVDERRDPIKSTHAALDYLQELHDRFGSWYLAAASYNTGENRVGRIMRERFGTERGEDAHFWQIAARLPRETRNYVPLMLAAAHIAKNPESYGFHGLRYQEPMEFDEVWVPGAVGMAAIARAIGATEDAIGYLNPQLREKRTPRGRSWPIRLPPGTQREFAANFPAIYRAEQLAQAAAEQRAREVAATAARHTVRRGETFSHIAARYGVSVTALRSANGNIAPTRLRAGQTIVVPGRTAAAAGTRAAAPASVRYHRVNRGENLTVIARRYGTTVGRLQSLNNLGRGTRIVAGQRLRVG